MRGLCSGSTGSRDGGSSYAGAEDFRYQPGIGLVAGKYSTQLNIGSQDTQHVLYHEKHYGAQINPRAPG